MINFIVNEIMPDWKKAGTLIPELCSLFAEYSDKTYVYKGCKD